MRRVSKPDVAGWWWAKVRDAAHPDIAWDWTPMDLRSERSFAYYSAGENARQCDWCGPIPTPDEQPAAVDVEALAEQVVRYLTPPEDGLDVMDVIAVGSMINRVLRKKGVRKLEEKTPGA